MFTLNPQFPDATDEQKWDQFRIYRLQQLQLTDFTQGQDCNLPQGEIKRYAVYRKFLRDTPSTYKRVEDIKFPTYAALVDYKLVLIDGNYQVKK